jgi:CMP/dCMP kinase
MSVKNKNIITLTGDLGSGKSKTGKLIASALGFDYISTGDIQRKLASELHLTTLEMNKLAEINPSIDEKIDSIFINLKDTPQRLVVDSRMAWHFLPHSFKVMLRADIDITTQRVLNDKIRKSEQNVAPDYQSLKESLIARKNSETKRFIEKYNADGTDLSNFDIIVDTSFISADDVAKIIVEQHAKWMNNQPFSKVWLSPKQLIPLKNSLGFSDEIIIKSTEFKGFYYLLTAESFVKKLIMSGISYTDVDLIFYQDYKNPEALVELDKTIQSYDEAFANEWQNELNFSFFKLP